MQWVRACKKWESSHEKFMQMTIPTSWNKTCKLHKSIKQFQINVDVTFLLVTYNEKQ